MIDKNAIFYLFFEEKLKQCDIAKKLGVSKQYIGEVLKAHPNTIKEKERRKAENKKNRIEYQKKYQHTYQRKNEDIDNYKQMQSQLDKDIYELSSHHEISNLAFINWNRSAYNYDKNSSDLVIKRKLNVTNDVPKRVRNVVNPHFIH